MSGVVGPGRSLAERDDEVGRDVGALRNEKVFLTGPLRTGSGTVLVSRFYVDSLQPLLQRLEAEVAERPELLQGEVEREYFEQALTTAP